jgi:hypothetical protein
MVPLIKKMMEGFNIPGPPEVPPYFLQGINCLISLMQNQPDPAVNLA